MTYEKLFKALRDGKKLRHSIHGDNGFYIYDGKKITNQSNEDITFAFLNNLLNSSQKDIDGFSIVKETQPYDMAYREALMYMLEKPGVHCVSCEYTKHYSSAKYIFNNNGLIVAKFKDGSTSSFYISIDVTERESMWRKEPDLEQDDTDVGQPGTDTDVATKKIFNEFLNTPFEVTSSGSRYLYIPQYKKGDKLLTPADVFKALLAGEKVTVNGSDPMVDEGDPFLIIGNDGMIHRISKFRESIESDWDFSSDDETWWEIA